MTTPKLLAVPFSRDGNRNEIYDTRQASQAENEATYAVGFPTITMQPKNEGGLPPLGLDFNGIFYDITSHVVYLNMGGEYYFNADYAAEVGGYPKGAILSNNANTMQYISTVDANKIDFNTADPASLTAWKVIAIADIDKLLAGKIDNTDLSNALNAKADKTITITAGNGMTGGGNLSANRTMTLGTPSDITGTSTNSVGANTHSHAIAKATTTESGVVTLSSSTNDQSENKAATPKAIYDLNQSISVARSESHNALTKANQVPNPVKDQILIGSSSTAYKLITLEAFTALLNIPAGVTVVNVTGTSTKDAVSQNMYSTLTFGINQKWSVVTGSRTLGATYTNTTSKLISVLVGFPDTDGKGPAASVSVDGVEIFRLVYDGGTNLGTASASFEVPAGSTYVVQNIEQSGWQGKVSVWAEMR